MPIKGGPGSVEPGPLSRFRRRQIDPLPDKPVGLSGSTSAETVRQLQSRRLSPMLQRANRPDDRSAALLLGSRDGADSWSRICQMGALLTPWEAANCVMALSRAA